MKATIEPVVQVRDWSIDRIHQLSESDSLEDYMNAVSIASEFDEWINIPDNISELDYMYIKTEGLDE
jgi:hypothetical protein